MGLKGICISLPEKHKIIHQEGIEIEKDEKYIYITVTNDVNEKTIIGNYQ